MAAEENHAAHPGGGSAAFVVGFLSGVAVQQGVGILPERWHRIGCARIGDTAADGQDLAKPVAITC